MPSKQFVASRQGEKGNEYGIETTQLGTRVIEIYKLFHVEVPRRDFGILKISSDSFGVNGACWQVTGLIWVSNYLPFLKERALSARGRRKEGILKKILRPGVRLLCHLKGGNEAQ